MVSFFKKMALAVTMVLGVSTAAQATPITGNLSGDFHLMTGQTMQTRAFSVTPTTGQIDGALTFNFGKMMAGNGTLNNQWSFNIIYTPVGGTAVQSQAFTVGGANNAPVTFTFTTDAFAGLMLGGTWAIKATYHGSDPGPNSFWYSGAVAGNTCMASGPCNTTSTSGTIPEPTTGLMFLVGMGALLATRRRQAA